MFEYAVSTFRSSSVVEIVLVSHFVDGPGRLTALEGHVRGQGGAMTELRQPGVSAGDRQSENILDIALQSRPSSAGSRVFGTTRSGRKSVTKFMSSVKGEWRDKGTSFR